MPETVSLLLAAVFQKAVSSVRHPMAVEISNED
ncbi:hypothetical protein SNOG_07824 [Parastagonospora nodorum SN15]|uniref:Uncharacterized protein n=1 Tax=Phaeosphaeria nodorum (strain SN15 / ATCC MYA-4574 / FGSC 10173) TaxID=321614 RepID=Q0UK90_PHANO|nr:hypothetical protein SNOG_07824 [Parastagonospora nodorum SN15]EAT85290.1 hypothetical protein SNOG_07824 [Parastagonospora nodorum SN15]